MPLIKFKQLQQLHDLQQNESCCVCLMEFEAGDECRATICKHYFHKECLDTWLAKRMNCPYCRCSLKRSDLESHQKEILKNEFQENSEQKKKPVVDDERCVENEPQNFQKFEINDSHSIIQEEQIQNNIKQLKPEQKIITQTEQHMVSKYEIEFVEQQSINKNQQQSKRSLRRSSFDSPKEQIKFGGELNELQNLIQLHSIKKRQSHQIEQIDSQLKSLQMGQHPLSSPNQSGSDEESSEIEKAEEPKQGRDEQQKKWKKNKNTIRQMKQNFISKIESQEFSDNN